MMSSPVAVAVFVAAAALSLGASAILVVRLERVGARLGLSEALLGLVAAPADTPEVTSAVTALAHGQHDVGTGVVLGSNVFNLAALIGLGAVIAGGIKLHRRVVLLEGTVALWIAALAIAAVTGLITPVAALALALAVLGCAPPPTSNPVTHLAAAGQGWRSPPPRQGRSSGCSLQRRPRARHRLQYQPAVALAAAGSSQTRCRGRHHRRLCARVRGITLAAQGCAARPARRRVGMTRAGAWPLSGAGTRPRRA